MVDAPIYNRVAAQTIGLVILHNAVINILEAGEPFLNRTLVPGSTTINHSSFVPHYNEAGSIALAYDLTQKWNNRK